MQKTAYEMRISDWSSVVCSSVLQVLVVHDAHRISDPDGDRLGDHSAVGGTGYGNGNRNRPGARPRLGKGGRASLVAAARHGGGQHPAAGVVRHQPAQAAFADRKSTRLNSSH